MWIRDELPRAIPGVRTIIYGYDSALEGSNSFQSIGDIALGLIHHLKSQGWNLDSAKPIVFLAHSLGGLVLKQALVYLAEGGTSISSILSNLAGAIMFGVPSLGMHQSHLMAMVQGQSNDTLIQDLSRENGSAYLRQLNKSFEGISFTRTVQIFWAYETKESPTVVVSIDSIVYQFTMMLTLCRHCLMVLEAEMALWQSL
jgi:alpha-beta hydrolase superfamily lysophospholipase